MVFVLSRHQHHFPPSVVISFHMLYRTSGGEETRQIGSFTRACSLCCRDVSSTLARGYVAKPCGCNRIRRVFGLKVVAHRRSRTGPRLVVTIQYHSARKSEDR